MGWPFRKSAGRKTRLPEAWEETSGLEPEVHPSPGFEALSQWVRTVSAPRILDLGDAVGPNLNYFAERSGRLHVVALYSALQGHPAGPERLDALSAQAFADLLPVTGEGSFDVILIWDLFNYLTRPQIRALGQQLTRLSHPGTRALAMISNRAQVPAAPVPFKIVDERTLLYPMSAPQKRTNPRWPPGEVQQAMKGFIVDRSFLLRHGIQEFLFIRDEG